MSPFPHTKYGGTFFIKKLCMREQTFLGKFFLGGDVLHGDKQSDHARDEVNG